MFGYFFILDYLFATPVVVAAVVFLLAIVLDRKSGVGSRVTAALLFAAGTLVVVFGGMRSSLFHDGFLPDDPETHGWQAVLSFGRAFLPWVVIALVCWSLGFVVRRLAKRKARARTIAPSEVQQLAGGLKNV